MILAPLSAASILILAASQQTLCQMDKPTEIEVIPSAKETVYDYSKSLADLQSVQMDTIDPHSFNGIPVTQGYTNGSIKLVPQVALHYQTFEQYGAACVWYDKISISLELDPTIVIAKEVQADPCMSEAVVDHEHKHVRVDRQIVNKYSQIIGREVNAALADRGFIAGPIKQSDMEAVADRMQKVVFQIVEHEYKKMDLEREDMQRAVDSKEEYDRVSRLCPDFNPMKLQQERKSR